MKPPTYKQQAVLDHLVRFHAEEDRFPSTREIAKHFKWKSQTASMSYLKALARKGLLEKRGSHYRFTR